MRSAEDFTGMKTLKAVAFDLDDTLLRDDLSISDYTVSVLRRLRDQGVRIIPASGRSRPSMLPFVEQIGCADLYIACNGAEIWNAKDHSLIRRETFPLETARRIIAFGQEHGCYTQTYDDARFYFNRHCHYADAYAASSMLKGEYVADLAAFVHDPSFKFLMMDDTEKIAALLPVAQEAFAGEASVTCSKPWFLEFNPPRATKGIALGDVLAGFGIPPSEAAAFGDSLNDWSMLSLCGLSVCVANARPELLSRCGAVCPSNQEDGVARYLEAHFVKAEEAKA